MLTANFKSTLIGYISILIGICAGCTLNPVKIMPNIKIMLPDGKGLLTTKDIPKGQAIILIHFNSECRECQEETEMIVKHIDSLSDVNIYFLSAESLDNIKMFRDYFSLEKQKNIIIGKDINGALPEHFHTHSTPLLAYYDSDRKLRVVIEGKTDMPEILKYVNKHR